MYSNIIKKIIFPISDKYFQTHIYKSIKEIIYLSKLTKNEILIWQNHKLKQLVKHAYKNTVYYKNIFDSLKLEPKDINCIEDLDKVPVLTKKIIRNNFNDLIPKNINNYPYNKNATGGSSGDPLAYFLDNKSWSFSTANNIYNWEKIGYKMGEKHLALGSTSLYVNKNQSIKHYLYYKIKNRIGVNGINMSDQVCENYISIIKKKKIKYLYGYASSIYMLSKYVIKKSIKLDIEICFTTSEVLTNIFRETIKTAFNSKILDCYGANDGGITAFEHENGFFEVSYNSLIRQANICNKEGSLLITDLLNYSMPFINYQIGDEVIIDKNKNKKFQYNGQLINKILGRISDVIELENGNVITGPGFTILFKDLPVEYYRIEKNDINSIKCSIVRLPKYTKKHEKIILSTVKKQIGKETKFILEYTDKLKVSANGKIQYFKS